MLSSLATCFGVGRAPIAPGTAGSLVAIFMAAALLQLEFGWLLLMGATLLVTCLGIVASNRYMAQHQHSHDPKQIVIDEVAGQWLTLCVWFGWLIGMTGSREAAFELLHTVSADPLSLAMGFLLFRLFDILKPWPISLADRRVKGGFGVMFDDLLAGLFAGTFLYAIYVVWPLLTGELAEHTV
jgi:phosphatidylglycerophosphatase A